MRSSTDICMDSIDVIMFVVRCGVGRGECSSVCIEVWEVLM